MNKSSIIASSQLDRPSAIAIMATNKNQEDLELLLTSIELFHPEIPIYFICDTYIAKYLEPWQDRLKLNIHNLLDKYASKDRAKTDKAFWLEFMLNKCRIIEIALETESDVVLLDADIILLNHLPAIAKKQFEVAMAPHYIHPHFDKSNVGFYNCGYVWTNTHRFPAWWRNNAHRSKYYEQQILDEADNHFKIFRLPPSENFGWWRALYQIPSRIGEIHLREADVFSGVFCGQDQINSIHTHFTGSNLTNEMSGFNLFIIRSLHQSRDPKLMAIYQVIKKQLKFNF